MLQLVIFPEAVFFFESGLAPSSFRVPPYVWSR